MAINERKLRQNLTNKAASYPKGSAKRRAILALLKGAEFDAEEIAEVESGPVDADSDEPYMDQFTQQEHSELQTRVEEDDIGGEVADTEETKMAGWRALEGEERKLFAGLVRLAKENEAARGPVMQMLAEQGFLAKGEVPEAFKKQWKDKDKDDDGKTNEDKPDFLKKKEEEKKDKKAAVKLTASQSIIASKAAEKAASKKQAAKLAFEVAIKRGSDVDAAKAIGLKAASLWVG